MVRMTDSWRTECDLCGRAWDYPEYMPVVHYCPRVYQSRLWAAVLVTTPIEIGLLAGLMGWL